jgi:hypothetical protein
MWSRFWDSFGGVESESQVSSDPNGSHHHLSGNRNSASHVDQVISPEPSTSLSQLQGFSEIQPHESASMVMHNDEASTVSSYRISSSTTKNNNSSSNNNNTNSSGSNGFTFKFTSLGGKTHRFMMKSNNYAHLLDSVRQKVLGEHVQFAAVSNNSASSSTTGSNIMDHRLDEAAEWLSISYMDDEDDLVLISSDADVEDAVLMAQKLDQTRVKLFVHDAAAPSQTAASSIISPTVMTNVPILKVDVAPSPTTPTAPQMDHRPRRNEQLETMTDDEEIEPSLLKKKKKSGVSPQHQDLLLPAAIAFLGVVIIGVFTYSRVNQS